jgi:nucleoside-diphosphate-sugar epimerase
MTTMHIFLAGATGAVGRAMIPRLLERGHTVTGTTRSPAKADGLRAMGVTPVVVDGLDRDAVVAAVAAARPDAIVHQMTALSSMNDIRHIDREFALTNRLRTEGTDNLLAAARAAGVQRIVAQSFAGWPYARTGGPVKSEDAPLATNPPKHMTEMLAAIRQLEATVTAADWTRGIVLRYGGFYGPGTSIGLDPEGEQITAARKRMLPIVGSGKGFASLIHIADAASATVAAIERGAPGIYNVVDDEPAPASEWIPALSAAIGAKPPRHFPAWLARLLAGDAVTTMMTDGRGASNQKAKRELGWEPEFSSWRRGFAEGLV